MVGVAVVCYGCRMFIVLFFVVWRCLCFFAIRRVGVVRCLFLAVSIVGDFQIGVWYRGCVLLLFVVALLVSVVCCWLRVVCAAAVGQLCCRLYVGGRVCCVLIVVCGVVVVCCFCLLLFVWL